MIRLIAVLATEITIMDYVVDTIITISDITIKIIIPIMVITVIAETVAVAVITE